MPFWIGFVCSIAVSCIATSAWVFSEWLAEYEDAEALFTLNHALVEGKRPQSTFKQMDAHGIFIVGKRCTFSVHGKQVAGHSLEKNPTMQGTASNREGIMFFDLKRIKGAVAAIPEIAACYLFGSAAKQEVVVNDLDLLILVRPEADAESAIWELTRKVSESLGVEADRVDILLFDLQLADPKVLYRAINEGTLLKNELPDLLTDKIETLSRYLVEHEYLMNEATRLRNELIEEFSADG